MSVRPATAHKSMAPNRRRKGRLCMDADGDQDRLPYLQFKLKLEVLINQAITLLDVKLQSGLKQ